jgi:hypothetical protein
VIEKEVFNKKKVLLVCAETFSWPMHYIAEEIRAHCESISAIFIQPGESYFKTPDFSEFSKLNKDINIYGMHDVVEKYIKYFRSADKYLDWNYINYIENEYSSFSSLNEQFLSEMTFLPYYHDRKYYKYIDYKKILLYTQLYYKHIEEIFRSNKPDLILDTDVDFFGRSVLLEVSNKNNVPYISLDHTRVDSYALPTTNLLKKRNEYLNNLFNKYTENKEILNDKSIEKKYIEYTDQAGEIPNIYKKMHSDHKFSVIGMIKNLIIRTYLSIRYFSLKKFKLNIFLGLSSPICSNTIESWKFMYMYYFRRMYLQYSNTFTNIDLNSINYLYVPLHVIPESSTTILSPYYINETFIIESLSKSVRADQYIVVKEHWSMIGYRPISYYNKIKKLPNVILINPATPLLPWDYISNADLVVTISGSAAMEGALIGKNSLVFSDVIFGMLSSVKKVYVDSNLKDIISEHTSHKMPKIEIYAYLKILMKYGKKVSIKNLLAPPSRVDKTIVKDDVKNLLKVLVSGIDLYDKNN